MQSGHWHLILDWLLPLSPELPWLFLVPVCFGASCFFKLVLSWAFSVQKPAQCFPCPIIASSKETKNNNNKTQPANISV